MQGTGTISDLVAGLDWVASNAKPPAVATLSLGVPVGQAPLLTGTCCIPSPSEKLILPSGLWGPASTS